MKFYLLCFAAILFSIHGIEAQVTIGSNIPAVKGALLDLKENNDNEAHANSSRGLLLSRVKLTDVSNLYPMFESSQTSGAPNESYNTVEKKKEQDELHTGLLVYNLNSCKGFSPGTYVWTGGNWKLMGPDKSTPLPTISVSVSGGGTCVKTEWDETSSTLLVHIPSGVDLRTLTNPFQFKIDWTPATVNLIKQSFTTDLVNHPLSNYDPNATPDSDEYARGGVAFASNGPDGWTNLSGGTGSYTFEVKAMNDPTDDLKIGWGEDYVQYPDGGYQKATPWRSRQNTLEFSVTEDVCNETTPIKIIFNQTNYHLWLGRKEYDFSQARRVKGGIQYYRMLIRPINENVHSGFNGNALGGGWDGNYFTAKTESNAWWKISINKTADYDDIIDDLKMPEGRYTNLNNGQGEYRLGQPPVYQSILSSVIKGLKMEPYPYGNTSVSYANNPSLFAYTTVPDRQARTAARLTFSSDWEDACKLFPDVEMDLVQCSARFDTDGIEDVGNNIDDSAWADKVLAHTDQNGNTFYSAKFGDARWMITNLAATTYADGTTWIDGSDQSKGSLSPLTSDKTNFYDIETVGPIYTYPLAGQGDDPYNWGNQAQALSGQGHTGYYKRWYPEYGIMYNWYAAVRESTLTTIHGNNEGQATPLDSAPGAFEVESTAAGGHRQGICPNGWHLPSDREWNHLERYFYNEVRNKSLAKTQYDEYDKARIQKDLDDNAYPVWNPNQGTATDWEISIDGSGNRGYDVREYDGGQYDPSSTKGVEGHIGHGGAMKAVCPPINEQQAWLPSTKGYSAELKLGGFNGMPLGRMFLGDKAAEISQYLTDYPQQSGQSLDDYMQAYVNSGWGRSKDDWNIILREYGYDSVFWTSSASSSRTSWSRDLGKYSTMVYRESYFMSFMVNVRCVKD